MFESLLKSKKFNHRELAVGCPLIEGELLQVVGVLNMAKRKMWQRR